VRSIHALSRGAHQVALLVLTMLAAALDTAALRGAAALDLPHLLLVLPLVLVAWPRGGRQQRSAPQPTELDTAAPAVAAVSRWALPSTALCTEIDARLLCRNTSPALAQWLGLRTEQLDGHSADEIFGSEPATTLVAAAEAALRGEPRRLRVCVRSLADGERWLQVELQPLPGSGGAVESCLLLALEVSAEQLELEVARRSERRLRLIMNQIPVTVSYIDADLRYRYINRAQEQWLGKTEAEVAGRCVREVAGERVWSDIEPRLRRALAGEQVAIERERTDRDGQRVWHAGQHVPDINDEGAVVGVYTVFYDITQRARAEHELRLREHELRVAKEAAEKSSRAKSEFLANMSHEIRTPMNGVLGLTELLLETPLDPQQRPFVETVRSSGESLLSIINDILDFSKIEAGKLETESLDFDLYQAVEDVVQLLAPRAHAKQLELACRIDDTLPTAVRGDPYRLRQVLTNLIGNAVKFTDAGEVVIDVTNEGGGRMRVSVRDTGVGIPPDARERLFKPFEQADGSTTRRFGGTGLGLAISRSLVELMGGQIGVECPAAGGTVFSFTLPLQEASALPPVPTPAALRERHALVVDDNATNREIIAGHLRAGGMRVECAVDGADALDQLRRAALHGDAFEMAVVDMKMPRMDGIELAAAVRAAAELADLKLVLVTSLHSPAEMQRARQVGIAAYLSKPVRRQELFRALAQSAGEAVETVDERSPDDAPRFGAHVLLAEDNGVNQVVARNMLRAMGCTLEIVANGRDALAAVQRGGFDLVLMDCQMPGMDGYDATRAIRAWESSRGRGEKIPVIALTANALVGDAETCRAAGMDAYLAKPYTRKQLAGLLRRWLVIDSTEPAVSESPPNAHEGLLDAAALDNIRSIDDDGSVVAEVIQMYLDEAPGHLAGLRAAESNGDWAEAGRIAHALKSASFNVGAVRLGEVCRDLERAGKAGEAVNARRLMAVVENLVVRVEPLLRAEIGREVNL
jgi:PAS domain S-box-containing protein